MIKILCVYKLMLSYKKLESYVLLIFLVHY
jgi:hypothetical protein